MSAESTIPAADAIPRLPRGVRLRHDETRDQWILLAPERILKLNGVALEILKRCDGEASVAAIVDDLTATFGADRDEVDADVREFLASLAEKRMLDL